MGHDTGIAWTDHTFKRCSACKEEHAISAFGRDPTRVDGLATRCLASRRVKLRKKHPGHKPGLLVETRDGDRAQARARVNYRVRRGELPTPRDLPCVDCGEIGGRHEYDHHLGYSREHQYDVQAVCCPCHAARERARGINTNRSRSNGGRFAKEAR